MQVTHLEICVKNDNDSFTPYDCCGDQTVEVELKCPSGLRIENGVLTSVKLSFPD